jgi:hypothetical protein
MCLADITGCAVNYSQAGIGSTRNPQFGQLLFE